MKGGKGSQREKVIRGICLERGKRGKRGKKGKRGKRGKGGKGKRGNAEKGKRFL